MRPVNALEASCARVPHANTPSNNSMLKKYFAIFLVTKLMLSFWFDAWFGCWFPKSRCSAFAATTAAQSPGRKNHVLSCFGGSLEDWLNAGEQRDDRAWG